MWKIQHKNATRKIYTKIQHKIYNTEIQHGNTTHHFSILIFFSTHTTWTGLYNTGHTTHHTTRIQHEKYNTKTLFSFVFFFSYTFSFLFPIIKWFCSFDLCFIYLKYILGQNQFFYPQMFDVIISLVSFCRISIFLWFPVCHRDFALLMLSHCWVYHFLRAVHPAKQSFFKCSYVLIRIVLRVSFSHWSTYFDPLKIYNTKNTTVIQHVYTTLWYKIYNTI